MNSESYESTIEDHGEGSIFVIISGIQNVDDAEEECEVFNEIIKYNFTTNKGKSFSWMPICFLKISKVLINIIFFYWKQISY